MGSGALESNARRVAAKGLSRRRRDVEGIRTETRYHSDEQVEEIVTKAAALVERLALADDLREAAFQTAANLYAQKNITVEAIQPGVATVALPRVLR